MRTRIRACLRGVVDTRYRVRLRRLGRDRSSEYRDYVDVQLRRTLGKRANDPGVGLRVLIGEVVARGRPAEGSPALCVGCRNAAELDEFRARGFDDVIGIDLFSQRDDIRVMDMHELAFPDDSFGVVYASHSLEHSYDLQTVAHEIARVTRDDAIVAVEVPVGDSASGADRLEFTGVDDLRVTFGPLVRQELWADEQPARTATNGQGCDIARLVFRVQKAPTLAPKRLPSARSGSKVGRKVAAGLSAGVLAFAIFGLLPELFGDWPYNPYGADARAHAHTTHAGHHSARS